MINDSTITPNDKLDFLQQYRVTDENIEINMNGSMNPTCPVFWRLS